MWKRRKCWLPAFSTFPAMFSKGFFPRVVKSVLCGKGLKPCKQILDWSKFNAFADKKLNFASARVENIVEKGENAGNQFFLSPKSF